MATVYQAHRGGETRKFHRHPCESMVQEGIDRNAFSAGHGVWAPPFAGATWSLILWHASHCPARDEYAKNPL
jgi:hypothetical protein